MIAIKLEVGWAEYDLAKLQRKPPRAVKHMWIDLDLVDGIFPLNEWIHDKKLVEAVCRVNPEMIQTDFLRDVRILFNDRCWQKVEDDGRDS